MGRWLLEMAKEENEVKNVKGNMNVIVKDSVKKKEKGKGRESVKRRGRGNRKGKENENESVRENAKGRRERGDTENGREKTAMEGAEKEVVHLVNEGLDQGRMKTKKTTNKGKTKMKKKAMGRWLLEMAKEENEVKNVKGNMNVIVKDSV